MIFFPSGPIIFPPIFVMTLTAGSPPMFFRTKKKKPLSNSTSRMTLGLAWLEATVLEGPRSVLVPFD
jgi:hypothetical protein